MKTAQPETTCWRAATCPTPNGTLQSYVSLADLAARFLLLRIAFHKW